MFECPEFMIALLRELGDRVAVVLWNKTQEVGYNPTANVGLCVKTPAFTMRSYYWGDCTCDSGDDWVGEDNHKSHCEMMQPNFVCGDVEVSWYKHLGRGTRINKKITAEEAVDIFNRCLESVEQVETF